MTNLPTTNTDVLRRAFDALRARDLDRCLSLMTGDFIINIAGMPQQRRGAAAWRQNVDVILTGFPDLDFRMDDVIAEGDRVAVRMTFTGTHTGEFMGVAPTGAQVEYSSYEIYRFEDGRIAEEWINSDVLSLLQQIGGVSGTRLAAMYLAGSRAKIALALGLLCGSVLGPALRFCIPAVVAPVRARSSTIRRGQTHRDVGRK